MRNGVDIATAAKMVGISHQAEIVLDHRYKYHYLSNELRERSQIEAIAKIKVWAEATDEEAQAIIEIVRQRARTIYDDGRVLPTYPQEQASADR